ncbi:MAG: asparaginase [Methanobacteriota archaeon]
MQNADLVVDCVRGNTVESRHRIHAAVVDAEGRLVLAVGRPKLVTFLRSSAKPFQAATVLSGVDDPAFTDDEVAVMSGSHTGEARHIEVVRGLLSRAGVPPTALQCGIGPDEHRAVVAGEKEPPLAHNCSGKHAGMLCLSRRLGGDLATYLSPEHPVQKANLATIARHAGVARTKVPIGIDGCGVPVHALPLHKMARMFARLAEGATPVLARVRDAMMKDPFLVGGTGRFDTALMPALPGRIVSKAGAEGLHCLGLPGRGLGLAVKVEDGNWRAVPPATCEILRHLGAVDEKTLEGPLAEHARPAVKTFGGVPAGYLSATLSVRAA